jgi:pyrethroid hydrolase
MEANFEVKYLDVTWYDKDTALSVVESFIPLELEFDSKIKGFNCNATIYPKAEGVRHAQLGFRFLRPDSLQPHIALPNGNKVGLKKIVDNKSNKEWWIEGNYWIAKDKCWDSKAYRTAGIIRVYLCDQFCQINIGLSEFSTQQLNRYLSDFKSDLWELIFDENSYVVGKAKRVHDRGMSEEIVPIFEKVLQHAQLILKSPKVELREIQVLKPRRKVKPVSRTFMEMATKREPPFLTSRATTSSYNVPENQYVLYVLEQIQKIMKRVLEVSKYKVKRYESMVERLEERIQFFSPQRKIDKEYYRSYLRKRWCLCNLDYLNKSLQEQIKSTKISEVSAAKILYFRIDNITKNFDGFFVGVKKNVSDCWFEKKIEDRYVFLKFSDDAVRKFFEIGFEYEVAAEFSLEKKRTQKGLLNCSYIINRLYNIRIIGGKELYSRRLSFDDELDKALKLKDDGWIKNLSRAELIEQKREQESVEKQKAIYQNLQNNLKSVCESLELKLSKIRDVLLGLKQLNIKPSATFPNSMTFVQNPDYQAVYSGFKAFNDIKGKNNLSDNLLLKLEKVEEIGLVNMPLLYERWCLLQIIKVLVQVFKYRTSSDWKCKLLEIISTRGRKQGVESSSDDADIEFFNDDVGRKIFLKYEPVLVNNRRPDFVMDVIAQSKEQGKQLRRRFVMDAKYYSTEVFEGLGGISNVVKDLYLRKNYSEDNKNFVFILHPAQGTIIDKVSPQSWADNSYLGELKLFDWDSDLRKNHYHQYGSVCISPVLRLGYLDELQRLIGMFLQYGIENYDKSSRSDDVSSFNFCLACGSHKLKIINGASNFKASRYMCEDCGHFTSYNHCNKCGTKLIKNGEYWSYHSHMPIEPFNIKCPACESLL